MRVEFAFDKQKLARLDISLEKVFEHLKQNFANYNLPCVSEGEVLSFSDTGNKNDYARIWNLIIHYLKTDWFISSATKCNFYEDDNSEYYEDVLHEMTEPSTKKLMDELR